MPPIASLIDVALAVVAGEVVLLFVYGARLGLRPLDVIGQLLAGVLLMIAVRCAVSGVDHRWTLVFLSASFPAHLFDLARRRAARLSPKSLAPPPPPSARS
ncbi:MAG: hypothetical protein U0270_11445 [Labilithrix sp.]